MKLFSKTLLIVIVNVTALALVTYQFSEKVMIEDSRRSDEVPWGSSW